MTEGSVTRIVLNNENEDPTKKRSLSKRNSKGKKDGVLVDLSLNLNEITKTNKSNRPQSVRNSSKALSEVEKEPSSCKYPATARPELTLSVSKRRSSKSPRTDTPPTTQETTAAPLPSDPKKLRTSKDKPVKQNSLFGRTRTIDNFFKKQEVKESGKDEIEITNVENSEVLSTKRRASIGSPINKAPSRKGSFSSPQSTAITPSLPTAVPTNIPPPEKSIKRESSSDKKPTIQTKSPNNSTILFGYPSKINFGVHSLILPTGIKKGDLIYFTWKVDENNSGVSNYYPVTDVAKIVWSAPEMMKIKVLVIGNIEKKYVQKKTILLQFKQAIELEKGEKTSCDPIFGEFVVNLSQYISMNKGNAFLESKAKVKENSNSKTLLKFSVQTRRIIEGYAIEGFELHSDTISEIKMAEEDKKLSKEYKPRVKELRRQNSKTTEQEETKSQSRVSFSTSQVDTEPKSNEVVVVNDKKLVQIEEKYKILEMKYNSVVEQCHTANRLYEELYTSTQNTQKNTGTNSNLSLLFDEGAQPEIDDSSLKKEELLNSLSELEERNNTLQQTNQDLQTFNDQITQENLKLQNIVLNFNEEMKFLVHQNKELQRRVEQLSVQCSIMETNNYGTYSGSSLADSPPTDPPQIGDTEIEVERYQFQHLKSYFKKLEDKSLTNIK